MTSTKATHTPGPWRYHKLTIGHPDNAHNPVVEAPGHYIARLFSADSTLPGMTSRAPVAKEAEANAYLIAAAPRLLAALESLANQVAAHRYNWGGAVAKARVIIAEARGQAPGAPGGA